MVKGLVSTVIPVYNRPQMLREAVASVFGQTYEPIEIIVVDDGSDHPEMAASLETCRLSGKGKVLILQQQNQGPGVARQHGLEHAKGEFVQFLDSDDILYPAKFELQVALLRRCPEAVIAYGKTRKSDAINLTDQPWKRTGEKFTELFPTLLAGRIWDTPTPLYRTSIVNQAGGSCDLSNEEDWEFDCRIAALGAKIAWVDEWVSEQRVTATNRVSTAGSSDPLKLRSRAKARHLILDSAMRAGVSPDAPEFQSFLRYSFLVARQCAAVGLETEAGKLVRRLNEVAPRRLMGLFLFAGKWIGYQRAARMAEGAYNLVRLDPRRVPS